MKVEVVNKEAEWEQDLNDWRKLLFQESENYPYAALFSDIESKILFVNLRAAKLFQYEPEELINGDLNLLLPTEIRYSHHGIVKRYFEEDHTALKELNVTGINKQDKEMNLVTSVLLKKHYVGEQEYKLASCYIRELERHIDKYLILPENPLYLSWILFIFIFIAVTMIYIPYEFVFYQRENAAFNVIIYLCTFIDICFNFNFAYVEGDSIVVDRRLIAKNYLLTYFLIDLQTGIPIELLSIYISKNVIMVFKLLRSLKLIKYYNALTNDYVMELLSKNKIFKELKMVANKYYYVYDILAVFCSYLLTIHVITCIWVLSCKLEGGTANWVSQSGLFSSDSMRIINVGHNSYRYDYTSQMYIPFDPANYSVSPFDWIHANPGEAFIGAFTEIAAEFLGYNNLNTYNNFEKNFSLFIMWTGLFYIAFSIGRLTLTITNVNKDNYKHKKLYQVLYSCASETDLSDNLIDKVLNELNNIETYNDLNISVFKDVLSSKIYKQMMTEYYAKFLDKFKMFYKLPYDCVEQFNHYSTFKMGGTVWKKNTFVQSLFFVTKGKVFIQNDHNVVLHDYEEQDLLCFNEFLIYVAANIPSLKQEALKYVDENSLLYKRNPRLVEGKVQYSNHAQGDLELEYYEIPFGRLEKLILNEKQLFQVILSYGVDQKSQVSKADLQYTKLELKMFDYYELPGLILLSDGKFYRSNEEFDKILNIDKEFLNEFYLTDCLVSSENDKGKITEMSNIQNGVYSMTLMKKEYEMNLTISYKSIVVSKFKIRNGVEVNVDVKSETYFVYFKLINNVEAFLMDKQKASKCIASVAVVDMGGTNLAVEESDLDKLRRELKDGHIKVEDITKMVQKKQKEEDERPKNRKPVMYSTLKKDRKVESSPKFVSNYKYLNQFFDTSDVENNPKLMEFTRELMTVEEDSQEVQVYEELEKRKNKINRFSKRSVF